MFSVSVTVWSAPRSALAGKSTTDVTVGVVVSICGPLWVRPLRDRLAALPAAVGDTGGVEIDRGGGKRGRVLAGGHGVAECERVGTGAAAIGGGAAVVERQGRGAARHRHRLA